MARRAQQCQRSLDRLSGVGLCRERGHEQGDDLVADELVDDCVVLDEHPRRDVIEAVQQAPKRAGADPLRDGGRAADVGEQEAGLDLGAALARLQDAEAERAVGRVLLPALPAQEVHQRAAQAAKWCRAHLAARLAGDVLEPRARARKTRVGPEQERPPHLLARSRSRRPLEIGRQRKSLQRRVPGGGYHRALDPVSCVSPRAPVGTVRCVLQPGETW